MKIFLTGATGFIGKHLCHRLVEDGHQVIALIRSRHKAKALPSGIEFIQGDLKIFSDPELTLPECDTIIHLAGIVAGKNEQEYTRINFEEVVSFIDCLERQSWKPKQFLFASSLAAGGPSSPGLPISEDMKPGPIDAYGNAKLKSENYLKSASFPTTSFRPAIVLGALDTATLTLYKMAKYGIAFRPSGPVQQVSWIDVDDLVSALVALCEQPDSQNRHRVYFVSHPDHTDVVTLMEEMGTALDKNIFFLRVPRPLLKSLSVIMSMLSQVIPFKNQLDEKQYQQITASAFLCSSDKLQKELNWSPKKNLKESIRQSIEGYKKAGWL